MTSREFVSLLDEVFTAVPDGPDWNLRFRNELKKQGIAIAEGLKPEGINPENWIVAPFCRDDQMAGWPRQTLLVWNPDFKPPRGARR